MPPPSSTREQRFVWRLGGNPRQFNVVKNEIEKYSSIIVSVEKMLRVFPFLLSLIIREKKSVWEIMGEIISRSKTFRENTLCKHIVKTHRERTNFAKPFRETTS